MSKISPFKKSTTPTKQETQPLGFTFGDARSSNQKSNPVKHQYTNVRYFNDDPAGLLTRTEKKRTERSNTIDIQNLLQKNKAFAKENAELYHMLQERARIIRVLQSKLQQQVNKEVKTLQMLQFQKRKFINDSTRKFGNYQKKINDLVQQINSLNDRVFQQSLAKNKQIDFLHQTFSRQNYNQIKSNKINQAAVIQISQIEKQNINNLIDIKNKEMNNLDYQFRQYTQKLKIQISALNNQITLINHAKQLQLAQQKFMYESAMHTISNQHLKQNQLLAAEYQLQIVNLQKQLGDKKIYIEKLQDQKTSKVMEHHMREQQLIVKSQKLQTQIEKQDLQSKQSQHNEVERVKQISYNQIKTMKIGNETIISNLNSQNDKLDHLVNIKSEQIAKLFGQIMNMRQQHQAQQKQSSSIIAELKNSMSQIQINNRQQMQRIKIKLTELREADVTALKQYYQHQILILNHQISIKNKQCEDNRKLLHQELDQKIQLRKCFDVESLKLNSRINELQIKLNQFYLQKKEDAENMANKIQFKTIMLAKQAKEKEKNSQSNEEERKKLYCLIQAKDKQIEQLNYKLSLLKDNHSNQLILKNRQLQFIKQTNDNLEVQIKKQKYFYQNQIKKKETALKNIKDIYESEVSRLKKIHRQEYQTIVKELSNQNNNLQIQLSTTKTNQKNIRNQLNSTQKLNYEVLTNKKDESKQEISRILLQKKQNQQKLHNHYQQEILKLNKELQDLKRKVQYKQEDLRNSYDKYNRLQKKMEMVIQSQQKLRNMQNKIASLGQENSIVKNLAQIMKSKKK